MSKAVIFFDPLFVEHDTGFGHPEKSERLPVAMEALEEAGVLSHVDVLKPRDATKEEIELVHTASYIQQVEKMSAAGGGHLDMDTAVSPETYSAALRAAGALLDSVDGCESGNFSRSFCLVRPPGHHALPGRGMGFCIFNNVALAARYAISKKGLDRVMIVDWDAHHGNGTQEIFYGDREVLYVSFHQYPHYPGTGWVDEIGRGEGKGYTINFPFPPDTGEDYYIKAFEKVLLPSGRDFAPDLLLVSAGYDSHSGDLLCSMRLSDGAYRKMTDLLLGLAEESCDGKLIVTLEGGYNLQAQARSIVQTIAGLAELDIPSSGEEPEASPYGDRADEIITEAAKLRGM